MYFSKVKGILPTETMLNMLDITYHTLNNNNIFSGSNSDVPLEEEKVKADEYVASEAGDDKAEERGKIVIHLFI